MSLNKYDPNTKELTTIAGAFNVQGIIENIGDLTELETTDKSSLVNAINEVKDDIPEVDNALSTSSTHALQNKVITSNILAIENVTGAKNLLPYPYYETTKTENGITFTDNGDGTITIGTGTASADTFFMYHESYENLRLSKNGQQYTLSGCPVGGGSSSYSLFFNYKIDDNTWGNAVYDNGDGVDISYSYTGSSSGGIYYGGIQIKSGTVISTPITFKPMIRDARITDPTYVPYAMTNRELTERVENIGGGLSVETYQVTLDPNSYSQWGWVYVVDKNGNSVTPEDGIFLRAWGESSNAVLTMDFAVIAEFGSRWMGRVRKVGNITDVTDFYGTMNFSFLRIS